MSKGLQATIPSRDCMNTHHPSSDGACALVDGAEASAGALGRVYSTALGKWEGFLYTKQLYSLVPPIREWSSRCSPNSPLHKRSHEKLCGGTGGQTVCMGSHRR